MAASFPSSIKSFSAVVNGVTKLVALLFNSNYDETEAVETFIGALGRSQSYSASLMNCLKNYRRGVRLEYSDEDTLIVTAGEISIPNASTGICFRVNTADITDLEFTDLDTGEEANSTLYYVYVVADASGTTFTAVISASDSAPSGYTYYRKIGSFYNGSGGDIVQESIYNNYSENARRLGDFISKSNNTPYLAYTDGTVQAFSDESTSGHTVKILCDGNNPPTTVRASNKTPRDYGGTATDQAYVISKIPKGKYWKVTGASTVLWIPEN